VARVGWIPFWQWIPGRAWRVVTTVEAADEIPARLPPQGAILVGSSQQPKWLAFDCPCKTGHRIMVSLDPAHRPHWVAKKEGKLSVSPSVDYRTSARRCHYWIINGKIEWVKEKDMEGRSRGRNR
jgi:hypothetical protein